MKAFEETLAWNRVSSDSLDFVAALSSTGPAPDRAAQMMLYGQFVGSWDGTVIVHRSNGERFESSCEVHFGWALAGRAVQDVWIVPSRTKRGPNDADRMYGTTLRIYDPAADHWRIYFIDPVRQSFDQMIGRAVGSDIVQEYRSAEGHLVQWCFTEIAADSFHWIARESTDQGATWKLTGEFFLSRRMKSDQAPSQDADHRQAFDFWLGSWNVTNRQSGEPLGVSRVDSILGGRVLHEHWSGLDGSRGESFNIFDRERNCWHQSWVSDDSLLLLDGGIHEGAMDLQGTAPDGTRQRIRWWPNRDGSVLQLWESSKDGGQSWECRFEGLYRH